jgi:hypothetical protein
MSRVDLLIIMKTHRERRQKKLCDESTFLESNFFEG